MDEVKPSQVSPSVSLNNFIEKSVMVVKEGKKYEVILKMDSSLKGVNTRELVKTALRSDNFVKERFNEGTILGKGYSIALKSQNQATIIDKASDKMQSILAGMVGMHKTDQKNLIESFAKAESLNGRYTKLASNPVAENLFSKQAWLSLKNTLIPMQTTLNQMKPMDAKNIQTFATQIQRAETMLENMEKEFYIRTTVARMGKIYEQIAGDKSKLTPIYNQLRYAIEISDFKIPIDQKKIDKIINDVENQQARIAQ